ncbi:hypothetical protein HY492_01915 [Candidatus Woesearchaeota archaeon]|nr:hypothetical protein [Candidatus Woesearchaeota archaeon]
MRLQRAGVLVAEPLGYFVQGNEQYAYSAFVEGRSPLDLLAEEKERQQIWDTDADMLARMCNAHLKQRGFYSEKFDDKIWTPQGLVLIDCDEAVDLDEYDTCAGLQGESLRTYHDETLRTALYHYVENNQLTEKEAFQYAKKFLEVRGDNPERAKELSTDLENSLIDEELWRYMRDHPEI